ncbi:MAG TPA: sigma factor [Ignavibacteria bacterium]|nr:sigma factor [Ignavibacteria bacterium]HMR40196.1 sigma factor [Ignavibacteria bacterium]
MYDLAANVNFIDLWNKLLRYSKRYNISHEDLEDIVSESIVKALEHFDEDRGSFESLCLVIIKNKIFNLTRHNKFLFLLVLIDDCNDIIEPDTKTLEDKEQNIMALKFIEKLKNKLDEEELKFLNVLYELCESSDKPNISKASRLIEIEPAKGWDIFRRIQRKAKLKEYETIFNEYFDVLAESESRVLFSRSINMLFFMDSEELNTDLKLNKFLESLSKENLSRLEKIYEK